MYIYIYIAGRGVQDVKSFIAKKPVFEGLTVF